MAIEDVADHLLLSVAQVKALEMDDYEKLPGATYIMGYWRSYAGLLRIDASESINLHKIKLDTTSSAIALERNHQRAHGHQEKSRKKSAMLFFLSSALFLSGIWYWQNPDDNPINQWVENLSNRQLTVRNTSTVTGDSQFSEEDTAFEVILEYAKHSVITLPEPNFSEEFETGEQEVLLTPVDDSIVSTVSSQAKLEQFQGISEPVEEQKVVLVDPDAAITVGAVEEVEIVSEEIETIQSRDGNPDDNQTENNSIPDSSVAVTEVSNLGASTVDVSTDSVAVPEVAQIPVVEASLPQLSSEVTNEVAGEASEESSTLAAGEAVEKLKNYDGDSPQWISLTVESQTWLDIRDSNAEKLIYRTANAGESIQLIGRPPFYVFIGAVDGVLVEYLGKTVEYEPDEKGLYSRFTLGELE